MIHFFSIADVSVRHFHQYHPSRTATNWRRTRRKLAWLQLSWLYDAYEQMRPPATIAWKVGEHNSNFTMVYGTYNELVTGVYKPTYN